MTGTELAFFVDLEPKTEDFGAAVAKGLSANPKTLPCRFFYDERGSTLFNLICETDEYYVTRTEVALLQQIGPELAEIAGPGKTVVEFGMGSDKKIRLLLAALHAPAAYVPIDISREHLKDGAAALAMDFPEIAVGAVCADFVDLNEIPIQEFTPDAALLGFFPGSTIGNLTPPEVQSFLGKVKSLLGKDAGFIVGVDLQKDVDRLNAAYNDAAGYTAEFNKNVLLRIRNELDVDLDLDAFRHVAFYNAADHRIEMHLQSQKDQTIQINGSSFFVSESEMIQTENSYKYTLDGFTAAARNAGFNPIHAWTDPENLFSIHYLRTPA